METGEQVTACRTSHGLCALAAEVNSQRRAIEKSGGAAASGGWLGAALIGGGQREKEEVASYLCLYLSPSLSMVS